MYMLVANNKENSHIPKMGENGPTKKYFKA